MIDTLWIFIWHVELFFNFSSTTHGKIFLSTPAAQRHGFLPYCVCSLILMVSFSFCHIFSLFQTLIVGVCIENIVGKVENNFIFIKSPSCKSSLSFIYKWGIAHRIFNWNEKRMTETKFEELQTFCSDTMLNHQYLFQNLTLIQINEFNYLIYIHFTTFFLAKSIYNISGDGLNDPL